MQRPTHSAKVGVGSWKRAVANASMEWVPAVVILVEVVIVTQSIPGCIHRICVYLLYVRVGWIQLCRHCESTAIISPSTLLVIGKTLEISFVTDQKAANCPSAW